MKIGQPVRIRERPDVGTGQIEAIWPTGHCRVVFPQAVFSRIRFGLLEVVDVAAEAERERRAVLKNEIISCLIEGDFERADHLYRTECDARDPKGWWRNELYQASVERARKKIASQRARAESQQAQNNHDSAPGSVRALPVPPQGRVVPSGQVPMPRPCGQLLWFDRLPKSAPALGILAIAWRLEDISADVWTRRLTAFKYGGRAEVWAAASALEAGLKSINWSPYRIAMVSALSHGDTHLRSGSQLELLGTTVCERLGFDWLPTALTKKPHRALHMLHGAGARDQELKDVYSARIPAGYDCVLVLDDLVTRGTTISSIATAIHADSPGLPVAGCVLGKHERSGFAATYGLVVNNDQVPKELGELWEEGLTLWNAREN